MKHYRYKTKLSDAFSLDNILNDMDKEGWEMCGICADTNSYTIVFRKVKE